MQTRYSIVGARFRPPAEDVLRMLPQGQRLVLVRQPENPYDAKAVAVVLPWQDDESMERLVIESCEAVGASVPDEELHLGYIPAKENSELSAHMDEHGPMDCTLTFGLHGGPMVEIAPLSAIHESETLPDDL